MIVPAVKSTSTFLASCVGLFAASVTCASTLYVFPSSNASTSVAGTVTLKLPSACTSAVYSFPFKLTVTICPSSISVVCPLISNGSSCSSSLIYPPLISSTLRSIVPSVKSTVTSSLSLVGFPA